MIEPNELPAGGDAARREAARETLAEWRERRRFARALEEDVGQELSLAAIWLRALESAPPSERTQRVRELTDIVRRAQRQLAALGFEMSPSLLLDAGFVAAAEWLCEKLAQEHQRQILLVGGDEMPELGEVERITLFRGLEKVLGARIQDGAQRVRIRISHDDEYVHVHVLDDAPRASEEHPVDLQRRIEHLGGRITTAANSHRHATETTIELPLHG